KAHADRLERARLALGLADRGEEAQQDILALRLRRPRANRAIHDVAAILDDRGKQLGAPCVEPDYPALHVRDAIQMPWLTSPNTRFIARARAPWRASSATIRAE